MNRLTIISALTAIALGTGCPPDKPDETGDTGPETVDLDGDGFVDGDDCDDSDPDVYPGADERCNEIDDDCDGEIDEDASDATTFYADADGDGYGDPDTTTEACEQAEGWITEAGDCDDSDASTFPGADEVCDEADNDCDGEIDEDAIDADTLYADMDEDGYGDGSDPVTSCEFPYGYVGDSTDCDDSDPEVNPGADELCNGIDDDCDDEVDEADAVDATTWYVDADSDGYGDSSSVDFACDQPAGYADNDFDCDDSSGAINPDADELCNGYDDDCDGTTDELGAVDAPTWYEDVDGDGYGDAGSTTDACEAPSGWVELDTDCDDSDAAINPAATELCDTVDNDCDGTVDEDDAADATTWYADLDNDGYGDSDAATTTCFQPTSHVLDTTDCDDSDATINPAADELCDGVDNDCDGDIDENSATDAATWYADDDSDAYGDALDTTIACYNPSGYVGNDDDCDDTDAAINPAATEVCDSVDNDCDGSVDEDDAADASTWYADSDSDGYGDAATTVTTCLMPSGWVADDTDCDDTDPAQYPGADERCNGEDDDCDGTIDEDDAVDAGTFYADDDGDGYGDPADTTVTCYQPSSTVTDNTDCDDSDAAQYPGADETCNGEDDDCDGTTDEDDAVDASTWYRDADGDGWGDDDDTTAACSEPSGYTVDGGDCDDSDAAISYDATELCDGVDNDCDGTIDENDAGDALTWYADDDGDGYGDASDTTAACAQPTGYLSDDSDCEDGDAAINPGATETCNAIDDDCDGTIDEDDASDALTWYEDADLDGYGDASSTTVACGEPTGYVEVDTDCDDGDDAINPGASESCNGVDDDCDGTVDDGVLGSGSACTAEDCSEILADDPSATDGWYDLDLGSYYCDMTTDGGGWTLVGDDVAVWGTSYDTTYYNSEGFSWTEALFAYVSGSAHAHCTYPDSLTSCNNIGMQFGSESWGVALNWGSSICGMSTTDYTGATSYIGGYDWTITRSESTDTVRVGTLEGISYCTPSDNPGTAYMDILVRL